MTAADALSGFVLPPELAARGYSLRTEEAEDVPFLRELYAASREQEFAMVETDWTFEQKRDFFDQQFAAQRHHYQTRIAGCQFMLLELAGERVGRLYLQERITRLQVVDIVLVSRLRNQGVGTLLINALLDLAHRGGKGVGLFVESYNPAMALYRRLGFKQIRETPMYLEMECLPGDVRLS